MIEKTTVTSSGQNNPLADSDESVQVINLDDPAQLASNEVAIAHELSRRQDFVRFLKSAYRIIVEVGHFVPDNDIVPEKIRIKNSLLKMQMGMYII